MSPNEVWITVYTLLLAGRAYAAIEQDDAVTDISNRNIPIDNLPALKFDSYIGAYHDVVMNPSSGFIKEECSIEIPNEGQLALTADFDHPVIHVIEGSDCGVKIHVTSEDVSGEWVLIGRYRFFNEAIERRLSFTINIEGVHPIEIEAEVTETEDDGITWLTSIEHRTRTDAEIDITLSRIIQDEECYIKPPNGDFVKLGETPITGVTFHSKSRYVSCRVTIGPMDSTLLGNWTLCGRYSDIEDHERCQFVSIVWNDNNNPGGLWHSTLQRAFDHPVSLEGTLTPVVLGTGSLLTCHIVTPEGEDLVMTPDLHYPGIQQTAINAASTCSIIISPIDSSMLGSWTIYGKFYHVVLGLNEVALPMNLFLYDEDNPHGQAYNVTNEDPINRVINLGTTITAEVSGRGSIDDCIYRSPGGEFYELNGDKNFNGVSFVNDANAIICRISMSPITEEMLGEWQIIGKFNDGSIFQERRQIFHVIQEDPKNPIIDEGRRVLNLTAQHHDTNIGSSLIITTSLTNFVTRQSCHVRTPSGLQYTIMDGFNLPGVEVIEGSNIECGINVTVSSEDMVGEWTLISRVLSLSEPIERRQPFTIYVEETVSAFPELITVAEGNSVYIRLKNPTHLYDTCKLIDPSDNERHHEIDPVHYQSCGFIIQNAQQIDNGEWTIIYGSSIVYKAYIEINVIERQNLTAKNLTFVKDTRVNIEYGPKDAIFCKIVDTIGLVVFDGFGKCNIVLERVTLEHYGYWKMYVGLPGQVIVTEETFLVNVIEEESKVVVSTRVVRERPAVVLTCFINSPNQVRACLFLNPKGEIRFAAQGVGESRYISENSQLTNGSDIYGHECGLRITEPTMEDLGLWRCDIETDADKHYGFLTVLCPWLMQDPEVQESVVTEPVLSSHVSSITSVEGDATTMSCSIQASIRYCYFRARNGTIYSVTPATSSAAMEYVGNGFEAGECGIRFNNLQQADSGRWSCHVGLMNDVEQEQLAQFQVTVEEPITVRYYRDEYYGLVVEAVVHGNRQLEYCRFVRIDGLGFTTDRVPAGYYDLSNLKKGMCILRIEEPTILNLHPWTVVARVRGQNVELSSSTTDNLFIFEIESEKRAKSIHVWITIIIIGLALILLGFSIGPKRNREWTYARASELRNSFRSSMRKTKNQETV